MYVCIVYICICILCVYTYVCIHLLPGKFVPQLKCIFRSTGPPEIQEFQFPSNLQEGNRAHVSCTVISGDLPIEIIWLKDGNPMPHEPDVQEKNHQFVSGLLFSKLASRHSGYYTCVARNAAAQTNFTSKLIVRGILLIMIIR